jgi:hypothetical protein
MEVLELQNYSTLAFGIHNQIFKQTQFWRPE